MTAVEIDLPVPITDLGSRARILREARHLFTAHGFAAVSMQQIADAATINKATLYHHFRDKEDLFVSMMEGELSRMGAGLASVIAEGGTAREILQRIARHIFVAQHSDFGRLIFDLHAHVSEEHRSALIGRVTPPWVPIRGVIERGIVTGEVRKVDADLVAKAFFAMVGSRMWWARFGGSRPEPDDVVAQMLADLLIDGIGNVHDSPSPPTATRKRVPGPSSRERGA
jgi:AcrR family transcriptional regulator